MKPARKTKPAMWLSVRGAVPVRCAVRAAKPAKPRKRLRARSKRGAERMALYRPMRAAYLWEHPRCEVVWDGVPCSEPAVDIHHCHGRLGDLLYYFPWWKAVCRRCHDLCETKMADAIRQGYQAEKGLRNAMPPYTSCRQLIIGLPGGQTVNIRVPVRFEDAAGDAIITADSIAFVELVHRHQQSLRAAS